MAILLRMQGELGESEFLFRKALQGYEKLYGEKHPHTINVQVNLGICLRQQERFEEAIELLKKVLELRREVNGEVSVEYALATNMLAGTYRDLGEFTIAYDLYKEGYGIIASEFGEESISAAVILNGMGLLYKK